MTFCNIHFRVKFFTEYHETIGLLGNIEALGCWDPGKACMLKTGNDFYPYWQTENPIKVNSGAKVEFKFAVFRGDQLVRWENLPEGENRSFRPRYFLVTLECSEAVPQFSEDISKRFVSSASLESRNLPAFLKYLTKIMIDLEEFKRVKKGKKNFNPFVNAQDSLSSDSWGDSSRDRISSEELNSFGQDDASPLRLLDPEDNGSENRKGFGLSLKPATEITTVEISKNNFTAHKPSDLERLLAKEEVRADALSILYHRYKKQNNIPKNKPTALVNVESENDSQAAELEDENIELSDCDKIIYVSFKLPVTINLVNPDETAMEKRWKVSINSNTHLGSIYRFQNRQLKNLLWIGWIGFFVEEKYQSELREYLYKEYNCIPIFLEEEDCGRFLYEYCNHFLHDAFFNILDMKTVFSQESYVESYNTVNKLYAGKILEHADLQTLIIVQDYHLMMVPKYLCLNNAKFSVGYIFETPFPTLEIIKVFYNKRELLESLLCCDLICFNTSEYVKMFANICNKLMNIHLSCEKGGHMCLKNAGRKVYIRVSYPSIDPFYISEILGSPAYNQLKAEVQEKYRSKNLIVGVAHFTKIEGIESLIQAVKTLFESEKNETYHFCLLKFEDVYKHDRRNTERNQYLQQIQTSMDGINDCLRQKGLTSSMEVIDEAISEEKKLAMMEVSKLLIAFSPYLDNDLHILEYLFTKIEGSGGIILSEFSHGHKHLSSLIKVNPFNKIEIIEGINKGLTRNIEMTSYLFEQDRTLVASYTAWDRFYSLLGDLKKAQSIKKKLNFLITEQEGDFKLLAVKENFMPLDSMKLLQDFKKSKKRLILCGFEETLVEEQIDPKSNILYDTNAQLSYDMFEDNMDVIRGVTLIPDTSVFVISSKKVDSVAQELESVPIAGLLAENGFYYRMPREKKWFSIFQCDWSWKSIVQRIMQNYATRTEGVKIEAKDSSIIWNHEDVRSEIAKIQEVELVNHLTTVLTHVKNLEIVKERRNVEVKPAGISKGIACELILDQSNAFEEAYPDFILCIGGTAKDEEMFAKIEHLAKSNPEFAKIACYTCCVKMKPSHARYYVKGVSEVYDLLRTLAENS